ncbi:MAG: hypothetical protein ABIZ04_09915 [Opitutus sp.]
MKIIAFVALLFAASGTSLRADFFSPFADARVGSTVSSDGEIVVDAPPGKAPVYFVRFRTDTGLEKLPAEITPGLLKSVRSGPAMITATIREREQVKTGAKIRFLEILKIESSK